MIKNYNYFSIPGLCFNELGKERLFFAIKEELNISKEELIKKLRKTELVDARKIFTSIYIKSMDKSTEKESLSDIGLLLNRDHATIIYYRRTANNLCKTDKKFKKKYEAVERCFMGNNS